MKKLSLRGLGQKKLLLTCVATSLLLALGSLAFLKLNEDNSPITEEVESIPQDLNAPLEPSSTRQPTEGGLSSSANETDPKPEGQNIHESTSADPFLIISTTSCISSNAEYQLASVVDVITSDKLSILMDGETYTVKFLGIDIDPTNEELNEQIVSSNKDLIGKTVALVSDRYDLDEEGNLIRYVFTEDTFVNLALVQEGLATVSETLPSDACAEIFRDAQEIAKLQELGFWARMKPEDWRHWPVIPTISENALEIYRRGLEAGTNPKLFSIIGDCQNIPGGSLFKKVNWDDFSLPPELEYLQPTLDNFRSIWSRQPVTVDGGFTPASMFSTYWTDTERCNPTETPLECEFRLNNASILLISIGSDQKPGTSENFDRYMRKIVEYSIENNVLPIIATDAYPTEEGFPLNYIMAQIAYDYDIPLWNFWAAVQDLPNHGLKEDNFHISAEAFAIKRITGIQVLHAVLTAAS